MMKLKNMLLLLTAIIFLAIGGVNTIEMEKTDKYLNLESIMNSASASGEGAMLLS